MRVGFVGLGRMGLPMARRVADAGHDVSGFDASTEALRWAAAAGLPTVGDLHELSGCELVCSSLPDSGDVEEVYCSAGGLLDMLEAPAVAADLSTVSVATSRRVAVEARRRSIDFLDAPVSGTSIHAEAGTLTVMVGGPARALEVARGVLEAFSGRVERVGDNGSGLLLKLISNRLLTAYLGAIAEAVVAMEQTGLDVAQGIELLRAGAAPRQLDYKAEPMAARDFTPMFTVDLMRKDLRLASEALGGARLAEAARAILDETAASSRGDQDLGALIATVEGYMAGP
ncbi:MAG: NAD(P)-dependent oxidoreductase [Acidimicrobiaceae bacterium]|nr:NAD(P)-dependent oxidoreductase [Acidimicrobiaceae bacterium]MYJ42706.1 NAD(P)-dependent oxidoreductase [Acidimicrobiaceae bacterium]